MPRITVRAPDTALAMEEVERQLGPQAYILSTRQRGGLVEIAAATDPLEAAPIPPAAIPASLEEARARVVAALAALETHAPHDLAREMSGLAYPDAVASRLRAALTAEHAVDADLAAALLPEQPPDLAASRTILLMGPAGGGRSLTAVKIAALLLDRDVRPLVIAPDEPGCEDRLWRFCAAMGLALHRPALSDAALIPGRPRIVDLPASDRVPPKAEAIRAMLAQGEGLGLLVLPADLAPSRAAEEAARWRGLAAHVVLTRCDLGPPSADLLCAIAAQGLTLALITGSRAPLDALRPATLADLTPKSPKAS